MFVWVFGRVGIRENEAADRVAIETLADLIPFPDLKPLTAKYTRGFLKLYYVLVGKVN